MSAYDELTDRLRKPDILHFAEARLPQGRLTWQCRMCHTLLRFTANYHTDLVTWQASPMRCAPSQRQILLKQTWVKS